MDVVVTTGHVKTYVRGTIVVFRHIRVARVSRLRRYESLKSVRVTLALVVMVIISIVGVAEAGTCSLVKHTSLPFRLPY